MKKMYVIVTSKNQFICHCDTITQAREMVRPGEHIKLTADWRRGR